MSHIPGIPPGILPETGLTPQPPSNAPVNTPISDATALRKTVIVTNARLNITIAIGGITDVRVEIEGGTIPERDDKAAVTITVSCHQATPEMLQSPPLQSAIISPVVTVSIKTNGKRIYKSLRISITTYDGTASIEQKPGHHTSSEKTVKSDGKGVIAAMWFNVSARAWLPWETQDTRSGTVYGTITPDMLDVSGFTVQSCVFLHKIQQDPDQIQQDPNQYVNVGILLLLIIPCTMTLLLVYINVTEDAHCIPYSTIFTRTHENGTQPPVKSIFIRNHVNGTQPPLTYQWRTPDANHQETNNTCQTASHKTTQNN